MRPDSLGHDKSHNAAVSRVLVEPSSPTCTAKTPVVIDSIKTIKRNQIAIKKERIVLQIAITDGDLHGSATGWEVNQMFISVKPLSNAEYCKSATRPTHKNHKSKPDYKGWSIPSNGKGCRNLFDKCLLTSRADGEIITARLEFVPHTYPPDRPIRRGIDRHCRKSIRA